MGLIGRVVLSVVVGVTVFLVCILVGMLMATMEAPFAVAVGHFFQQYAGLIGLLAALWFFFTGGGSTWSLPWRNPPP